MQRFIWTKRAVERLSWLTLEGVDHDAIARELGCKPRTARQMQFELGLVKPQGRRFWSKDDIATLRALYPDTKTEAIAAKLGRSVGQVYQHAQGLGLAKSEAYLAGPDACRLRRGDSVGAATRFKKGLTPANKGLRRPGWGPGRMKETQFRKGQRTGAAARNWKPVGTITPDTEGFLRVKVREPQPGERPTGFGNQKIWPLLNRYTWEQHNGPIPAGHNIAFKDRDRKNCDISNLECITRAEQMRRNTIHNYPPELRETIHLLGQVKRRINEQCQKTQ